MQITFSKLEPIAEATIDTEKKLNVIIGENGIGKTYLSIMVYAILHAMTSSLFLFRRHLISEDLFREKEIDATIKKAQAENGYKRFCMNIEDILKSETIKIEKSYQLDNFVNDVFASGNIKKNFPNLSIDIDLTPLYDKIKQLDNFKIENKHGADLDT